MCPLSSYGFHRVKSIRAGETCPAAGDGETVKEATETGGTLARRRGIVHCGLLDIENSRGWTESYMAVRRHYEGSEWRISRVGPNALLPYLGAKVSHYAPASVFLLFNIRKNIRTPASTERIAIRTCPPLRYVRHPPLIFGMSISYLVPVSRPSHLSHDGSGGICSL